MARMSRSFSCRSLKSISTIRDAVDSELRIYSTIYLNLADCSKSPPTLSLASAGGPLAAAFGGWLLEVPVVSIMVEVGAAADCGSSLSFRDLSRSF